MAVRGYTVQGCDACLPDTLKNTVVFKTAVFLHEAIVLL